MTHGPDGAELPAVSYEPTFQTVERPDLGNQKFISCVPAGEYRVEWHPSRFGYSYRLLDVPERDGILIHAANWPYQLEGCIALGLTRGLINNRYGVGSSRKALKLFEKLLRRDGAQASFSLTIEDGQTEKDMT